MFDSAKKRKVATEVGLVPSASKLSAIVATFFANRRNRLRVFLLKRRGAAHEPNDSAAAEARIIFPSNVVAGSQIAPLDMREFVRNPLENS